MAKENDSSQKLVDRINRRLWPELPENNTVRALLESKTKENLNEIRRHLQLQGVSQLNKRDLIEVLIEAIPAYIREIPELWDEETYHLILKAARQKNGWKHDGKISFLKIHSLRNTGVLFPGTRNGEKTWVVPEEFVPVVFEVDKDKDSRRKVKRNSEWIALTEGMLHYYGVLTHEELFHLLDSYTDEKINFEDVFRVLFNFASVTEDIISFPSGFADLLVMEPYKILQEHASRPDVPFYPFSKEQLLRASETEYLDNTRPRREMVSFLTSSYELSDIEAEELVDECILQNLQGDGIGEILQFLSEVLEFADEKEINATMAQLMNLLNNTREWALKGHTSMELRTDETSSVGPVQKAGKIGRNEPCPCGSGKKYKKCCGA